jgi:hypothetical protein
VPWRLSHCELFRDRAEAVRRERFLKTGKGREELDRILSANPASLDEFTTGIAEKNLSSNNSSFSAASHPLGNRH